LLRAFQQPLAVANSPARLAYTLLRKGTKGTAPAQYQQVGPVLTPLFGKECESFAGFDDVLRPAITWQQV
jgi:hypothetical protein